MPFQQVPDTVEIVIRYLRAGEEMINTFYAQKTGGYVLADLEGLASDIDGWVENWVKPLIPGDTVYTRTDIRGLDTAIDLQASNSDSAGAGTGGDAGTVNNSTIAIKRSSGFTGRAARGRIFWPAIPTSGQSTNDTVSQTFADALVTALDAMNDIITADTFVAVIVHRTSAGVPLVPAVVFTIVEWVVVDLVMDSMRRRLPGRGS